MLFSEREKAALASLLKTYSVKTGTFTLASGETSNVYCDVRKTSLRGDGAFLIGRGLWSLIDALGAPNQAVGGLTLGADPLVTAIAMTAYGTGRPYHSFIVRKAAKDHGTKRRLEAPGTLEELSHIIAVEDTVSTANSVCQAIEVLRSEGYQVKHAVCVVDREMGGREKLAEIGVELHALFTLDELTDQET